MVWDNDDLVKILKNGGVAIIPTDTIYGVVGQAQNISTVNRIYNLKKRNPEKPCIILIGNINELEKFSIVLTPEQKNKLGEFWPISAIADIGQGRATSIILDCLGEEFSYLHRGVKTLAFRLPSSPALRNLLLETGPLIAPSANPEGLPPAKNITEAKKYFGDSVDFYLDGGEVDNKHSKLIQLRKDGTINILRK
jgi:L-threonylcarbamoyladenylate synthase